LESAAQKRLAHACWSLGATCAHTRCWRRCAGLAANTCAPNRCWHTGVSRRLMRVYIHRHRNQRRRCSQVQTHTAGLLVGWVRRAVARTAATRALVVVFCTYRGWCGLGLCPDNDPPAVVCLHPRRQGSRVRHELTGQWRQQQHEHEQQQQLWHQGRQQGHETHGAHVQHTCGMSGLVS
jgi:hypothetical protein